MQDTYITSSAGQTKKLAERLAKEILQCPLAKGAKVIALQGDLGSGKTTFLQGFAKGLGIKDKILSPTFVILKKFKITNLKSQAPKLFETFYHIDCYRIEDSKEILALGFKEIVAEPDNIVAIEWAERIKPILPKDCLEIKFELLSKTKRCVRVCSL